MAKLLSTEQACEHIGVHRNTMLAWRQSGKGPAYLKIGRRIKYKVEDLDAWLESKSEDPEGSSNG